MQHKQRAGNMDVQPPKQKNGLCPTDVRLLVAGNRVVYGTQEVLVTRQWRSMSHGQSMALLSTPRKFRLWRVHGVCLKIWYMILLLAYDLPWLFIIGLYPM